MSGTSDAPSSPFGSRKRTFLGVLLILLALLLIVLLLRGTKAEAPSRPEVSTATRSRSRSRPHRPRAVRIAQDNVPPAFRGPAPQAPIIDKIIVEKSEVCQGEENLITVQAHTPGHLDDAYLKVLVAGHPGRSYPLRTYLRTDGSQPKQQQVTVEGRGGTVTQAPIPFYRVKKCRPNQRLVIQARMLLNTVETREFAARIVAIGPSDQRGPLLKAARYHWDFGDGKHRTTSDPVAIHDYRGRIQDTLYSDYIITCIAESAGGKRLVGRMTLHIKNLAFDYYVHNGVVVILHQMTPRYPKMNEDGIVEQQVLIWHHYDKPVTITRATRKVFRRAKTSDPPDPPEGEEISVTKLLGTAVVPQEGIESMVSFDARADKEVLYVRYDLEGVTEDDVPARGSFSIMRPTPNPTRENHKPVKNPVLTKMIIRARQILGKEFVTDEDLLRLVRAGYFDDLRDEWVQSRLGQRARIRRGGR